MLPHAAQLWSLPPLFSSWVSCPLPPPGAGRSKPAAGRSGCQQRDARRQPALVTMANRVYLNLAYVVPRAALWLLLFVVALLDGIRHRSVRSRG